MIGPRGGSDTMAVTLSEVAFLLLSVTLVAAILLAAALEHSQTAAASARMRAESLQVKVESLEHEVDELNEALEQLLGGVVACWRRPGTSIPPIVATITIGGSFSLSIHRAQGTSPTVPSFVETTPEQMREDLAAELRRYLKPELSVASQESCYLRVAVRNQTGSYRLYKIVEEAVRDLGMVVVPE